VQGVPEHETGLSSPSSAEVLNTWEFTPTVFMMCLCMGVP